MSNKEDACVLCDYNQSYSRHFENYGAKPLDRMVVAETENFLVKPDCLPTEPQKGIHLLLHPKAHTFNMAQAHHEHAWEIGRLMWHLEHRFGSARRVRTRRH